MSQRPTPEDARDDTAKASPKPRATPAEDLQGQDDESRDPSAEKPDVSQRPDPGLHRHDKGPKSGGMGPKQ